MEADGLQDFGGRPPRSLRRILVGVMSSLEDFERRAIMRNTWIAEAREAAPAVTVLFVLGSNGSLETEAAIAQENSTHADLVVLPCHENQHHGKTFHWFAFAAAQYGFFNFVAKMDQDVIVWPNELQAHVQGFARKRFYGGLPVDVHRWKFVNDRFVFMNGGFCVLSMDLVREVKQLVSTLTPTKEGFLDDTPDLKGNEDVILGRVFKGYWTEGTLNLNRGDFPWSKSSGNPPDSKELSRRTCPWRHAQELKAVDGYKRQWLRKEHTSCRCNCPDEGDPKGVGTQGPARQEKTRKDL